ncbi:MAG: hypothetical protein A3C55_01385 [Gammaproteobacteria bacterium RIFCSPHIGHO2_02_FULL_42_13]|nr:MAG: hypothetical protein A3C55_01385 [Gammaproteobacteria bacterium RIFCSPHIGHO2_02_FULL_42_13]OGT68930.1 MAG: hypothetical protein A3H43_03510 [Gammaproteobacteria bacterium RIFCSPLOWO2_02_FULL_42_9]
MLTKFIGDDFVYDGKTGKMLLSQNAAFIDYFLGGKNLSETMFRLCEEVFSEKSLAGYAVPSLEEIKAVKCNKFIFNLTEDCNLRCAYCPYSGGEETLKNRVRSHQVLSKSMAEQGIAFLKKYAGTKPAIAFYGGEPMLNFDLMKYIVGRVKEELPECSDRMLTTTNLTVFNDEIAAFLVKNEITIFVSIDGSKQINDRYRSFSNKQGVFDIVYNNLLKLHHDYPAYYQSHVAVNSVLAPPIDCDDINDFFKSQLPPVAQNTFRLAADYYDTIYREHGTTREAERRKIDEWAMAKLVTCQARADILKEPLLKDWCETGKAFIAMCKPVNEDGFRPFVSCVPGSVVLLNVDGTLSICERCESMKIGDVSQGYDFNKIKKIIDGWQDVLKDKCLNCWASAFCKSCYKSAWDGAGYSKNDLSDYCQALCDRVEWCLDRLYSFKLKKPDVWDVLFPPE